MTLSDLLPDTGQPDRRLEVAISAVA